MLCFVIEISIVVCILYRYVQDATDAYNVPADWRIWPETALKGKCCFIVNVSEAAKPYFVVARDEAEKR